jgi:hypothetical protein
MVEIHLTCGEGGHPFVKTFTDPVDWNAVNLALKESLCEQHKAAHFVNFDYCDC